MTGTETTATALSGLIYLLHQPDNRYALDKLKAEVRGTFQSLEDINLDSLARLEYMHAVVQEGLRMYPPVDLSTTPTIVATYSSHRLRVNFHDELFPREWSLMASPYREISPSVFTLWLLSGLQYTSAARETFGLSDGSAISHTRTII